jgi:hypothetical protein
VRDLALEQYGDWIDGKDSYLAAHWRCQGVDFLYRINRWRKLIGFGPLDEREAIKSLSPRTLWWLGQLSLALFSVGIATTLVGGIALALTGLYVAREGG